MDSDTIQITCPKPFAHVGGRFVLKGYVPKSWLETGYGRDYRVFLDFIENGGQTFIGSSTDVKKVFLERFRKMLPFHTVIQFHYLNASFIENSQGRINIKMSGHKEGGAFFLPLIVDGFEPEDGVDADIEERHRNMGNIIRQYEEDLKEYYKESEKIEASRKQKEEVALSGSSENYVYARMDTVGFELLKIIDEFGDSSIDYLYSEEDKRKKELEERYKDALAWRGPLLHGLAAKLDGFEMRVYSDDHGQHFHVIHRGKNINARFSYPQMELMSYVSGTSISARTATKIGDFCKQPEIRAKLEVEFAKRSVAAI
jgi:hypothetical protein